MLYQALKEISEKSRHQPAELSEYLQAGREKLSNLPDVDLKYLVACDVDSLKELGRAVTPMVLLVAAKFKEVWLIDTLMVKN